MPQIKEYNQRTEVTDPIQTRRISGEDMGAGLYKQIQQTGDSAVMLGDAMYKKAQQAEVTDATVKFAEYQAKKTNELQDQIRAGTVNPEEFNNKLDEELGQMSGDYSTRAASDYFEKAAAQLKAHFQTSAAAAGAEIAGTKAVEGHKLEIDQRSATLMKEPSDFKNTLELQNQSIDAKVAAGILPFKAGEELKSMARKDFGKAAIRGWMDLDPKGTQEQLKSGQWDDVLGGDEKKQLLGEIQTHITAQTVEKLRIESEQRKAKEYADRDTQNVMLTRMYSGQLSTKDILQSNLDFGNKKEMLTMLQTHVEQGEKIRTDAGTYVDIFNRIHAPDGDPNKITDESELNKYLGKGLTLENINSFRAEIQNKHTEQGQFETKMEQQVLKAAEQSLVRANPMLGIKDPDGEMALAGFMQHFQQKKDEFRKAGKSIMDLLNPSSKDYVGNDIKTFMKTPQQIMKSNMDMLKNDGQQNTAAPQPAIDPEKARKPNESIIEWRKRTKGK